MPKRMSLFDRIEAMAALPVAERRKLSKKLVAELRAERALRRDVVDQLRRSGVRVVERG